jgi:outer membrane lipoprotein
MRGRLARSVGMVALLFVVSGCATAPLSPVAGRVISPSAAAAEGVTGEVQLWGGVIVAVRNLEDSTWIEVVSYPLRRQQPRAGVMTNGRFLLRAEGFLDPLDYRAGRRLTARGPVTGVEDGKIGEVGYRFPVLAAEELHLWPDGPTGGEQRGWGNVRFGIGIGIGL